MRFLGWQELHYSYLPDFVRLAKSDSTVVDMLATIGHSNGYASGSAEPISTPPIDPFQSSVWPLWITIIF